MKTREQYAAMAERLAIQSHRFTYSDASDPVTGGALATEALVYATLATVAPSGTEAEIAAKAYRTAADAMTAQGNEDGANLLNTMAAAHVEGAQAPDTLPAWLFQRFAEAAQRRSWDDLGDDTHTYWAHHAAAVRRAVARGGFKNPAGDPR